ncbi:MAG: NAD-dependent epimerase/dehydratase family protein [Candidatus Latescibacterota bacterium]
MRGGERIRTEEELDAFLSVPQPETVELMKRLDGDIMVLGISGKMGPTLGRMIVDAARDAGVQKNVYGVSRFTDSGAVEKLESWGVSCIRCDLMDMNQVARLPKVRNIIYMAGRKFGKVGTDYLYWAINAVAPANAARHFHSSRFVAFSTGSIYDLWPSESNGPSETDSFVSLGEYANSCLARERIFEYYSRANGTEMLHFRLNYAIDLRYGVLFEIGRQVFEETPINLGMGYANVIWQGDANNIAIRCLEHVSNPPAILNVTGDKIRIRDIALRFSEVLGKEPRFAGIEAETALLSNNARMKSLFGPPPTGPDQMIGWIAEWLQRGGRSLGKPTHFQTRDGQFLDT